MHHYYFHHGKRNVKVIISTWCKCGQKCRVLSRNRLIRIVHPEPKCEYHTLGLQEKEYVRQNTAFLGVDNQRN